jgi:hypothetical protein
MAMDIASLHLRAPHPQHAFTSRFRHQAAINWPFFATGAAFVAVRKMGDLRGAGALPTRMHNVCA